MKNFFKFLVINFLLCTFIISPVFIISGCKDYKYENGSYIRNKITKEKGVILERYGDEGICGAKKYRIKLFNSEKTVWYESETEIFEDNDPNNPKFLGEP